MKDAQVGMAWADVAHVRSYGRGFLPFHYSLFVFELCARVLEAKTLIGHCILLKKAMNMKIGGVIH